MELSLVTFSFIVLQQQELIDLFVNAELQILATAPSTNLPKNQRKTCF